MNMKKLAIITFTIATLLVPGNGHAADKSSALLTNVTGVVTDSSNIRAWTSPILKAHSFMRRLPET